MKIYTKSGDQGQTSLVNNRRVSKGDLRIDLYGEVDELNAHLGLLITSIEREQLVLDPNQFELLQTIQEELFKLGSLLACESQFHQQFKLDQIDRLLSGKIEKTIDEMEKHLTPLRNFILPGGGFLSAQTHVCRAVCRRVERKLVSFADLHIGEVSTEAIVFINRLSDYLFVFSRYLAKAQGKQEVLWRPK